MDQKDIVLETTAGTIIVELYWDQAPKACKNIYELVKREYYNNTLFHRVIKDFMVQGGDPTGTGKGGASIYGEKFEDEIDPSLKHTGAGIVSMANSVGYHNSITASILIPSLGPNTNGSQFFITLAPTPWLDGKHTIIGRVREGVKVLNRLGLVSTDAKDRPTEPIKIMKAYIE